MSSYFYMNIVVIIFLYISRYTSDIKNKWILNRVCSWNIHKNINPNHCCRFHASEVEKIFFQTFINIFTLDFFCGYVQIAWNCICTARYVHVLHKKVHRNLCSPSGTAPNSTFVHKILLNPQIEHPSVNGA